MTQVVLFRERSLRAFHWTLFCASPSLTKEFSTLISTSYSRYDRAT